MRVIHEVFQNFDFEANCIGPIGCRKGFRWLLLCAVVLSAAPGASVHAQTVDFTFTPTGGAPVTFTLDSSAPSDYVTGEDSEFDNVTFSDGSDVILDFANPDYFAAEGVGPADLELINMTAGTDDVFYGSQLYTGSESSPTFLAGDYTLDPAIVFGDPDSGTLDITLEPASEPGGGGLSNIAVSSVPEPSAIAMLGTGSLICAGFARRRLRKACAAS